MTAKMKTCKKEEDNPKNEKRQQNEDDPKIERAPMVVNINVFSPLPTTHKILRPLLADTLCCTLSNVPSFIFYL